MKKRLVVELTPEEHQALKAKCANEGMTMTGLIKKLIRELLK